VTNEKNIKKIIKLSIKEEIVDEESHSNIDQMFNMMKFTLNTYIRDLT